MSLNRRALLQGASGAATACLLAGGAALVAPGSAARTAQALRPPGALDEADFLAACVRCGLCVRDCPPQNLRLSTGTGDGRTVAIGTPYFVARDIPCAMCEDIPCVRACPSGALDPALRRIEDARMGLAVLIDHESCLNFLGLRCDVCYRVCPVIDRAITLEKVSNPRSDRHAMLLPTVHADACTGCGACEQGCVLPRPAIKVLPRPLAQGEAASHYRAPGQGLPPAAAGAGAQAQPGAATAPGPAARPDFQRPVQRLPADGSDLGPLRDGRPAYPDAGGGRTP
ncbi:MAG: hypothetical protein RLY78_2951 [Pseudomonadota bacterium]|jgi:ferredoxin-type protein NapG